MNAIQSPTDPWMTIADLSAYLDAQADVSKLWNDQENWTKKSIINTAMSGRFSSDRTITAWGDCLQAGGELRTLFRTR